MKVGQVVDYHEGGKKKAVSARVSEITGHGKAPGFFKQLNLVVGDDPDDKNNTEVKNVPHFNDAGKGEPFWLNAGQELPKPAPTPPAPTPTPTPTPPPAPRR